MLPFRQPVQFLKSSQCAKPSFRIKRYGVMLHFDDSSQDKWAVAWFKDPACKVSYNRLYLRSGDVVQITPTMEHVAYHAGVCTVKYPNTRYYGLAAAADTTQPVNAAQFNAIAADAAALFDLNEWSKDEVDARIIGHEDTACFANGKLGRKIDPTGLHKDAPILSTAAVRLAVKGLL